MLCVYFAGMTCYSKVVSIFPIHIVMIHHLARGKRIEVVGFVDSCLGSPLRQANKWFCPFGIQPTPKRDWIYASGYLFQLTVIQWSRSRVCCRFTWVKKHRPQWWLLHNCISFCHTSRRDCCEMFQSRKYFSTRDFWNSVQSSRGFWRSHLTKKRLASTFQLNFLHLL